MFALRINDGATESLEEIFELSEEEVFAKITPVNAVFAPPGGSETASWNLTESGSLRGRLLHPRRFRRRDRR